MKNEGAGRHGGRTGSRRRGRRKKRSGRSGRGRADLISALPDDILLQVLARLPCAAAAARTSILSRRWRGLWIRLPELTFRDVAVGRLRPVLGSLGAAVVGPGVPFLDIVFSSVKAAAGVPLLDSSVPRHELQERVVAGLPSLLQAAAGLSPVEFQLVLPLCLQHADVDMPPFHRATSIQVHAWDARLKLPPAIDGFPKLENLTLSGCSVDLAGLVLRCPCLRVLRVIEASLDAGVNIQSKSLQKLIVRTKKNDRCTNCIKVEAPMLKQLTMSFGTDAGAKLSVSLVAPILQKVSWGCWYGTKNAGLGPWGISKVSLHAADNLGHRMITGAGEANVYVLSLQTSTSGGFHAQLDQEIEKHLVTDFCVLDLTMVYDNGLGQSTRHVFGPFVLHLLGMHRIRTATRRLQIQFLGLEVKGKCQINCPCDEPKNWRSKNITLINLEEVEIKGFVGKDHEFDFLRVIFRCAPMLKRISVRMSDEAARSKDTKIHEIFKEYPFVECSLMQR